MKRALNPAILLLLVVSVRAQQPASPVETEEIHLRATVKAIVPLADFSGETTPVDVDPRFALTVRIVSAFPTVEQFSNGALITLAIHSPSLLFAGEAEKGKTYDFYLRRKVESGQVRFFGFDQLWSWFGKCGQESDMGLEVVLTGKVIYRTSFPICPIRDWSEEVNKALVFSLKGGHVFQGEYHTTRAQTIEGNIWQAGCDPGIIYLGVTFSTDKQVLLNTIHIAKAGKASFSEIDRGLTVRTFPIRRKHSE